MSKGENPNETEPMYIKHSVSLIGTGGLAYPPNGENMYETEHESNEHIVSFIGTTCMSYRPVREGGARSRAYVQLTQFAINRNRRPGTSVKGKEPERNREYVQ